MTMLLYRIPAAMLLHLSLFIFATQAADFWKDLDHYDTRGIPIYQGPRPTDFNLERRQALRSPSSYQQTITATTVGPDGFTTVPYATNGQQCSSISNDIYAVYDTYGVQYLYICGGAITGDIVGSMAGQNWSACLTACDLASNCTGVSYNDGGNYGVMSNGAGRCTFKSQNGMYFTTTGSGQLISTRMAGMQRLRYQISKFA